MNKELTIKERVALLMGLMSNSPLQIPTADAKQALRILKSLETNTSKTRGSTKSINNPVTNTTVTMDRGPKGSEVSFKTANGYNRPNKPNTSTQRQGIQATVNQMLSEIPIKGGDGDSRYTAWPLDDEGDLRRRGRRTHENQRAKAYRRMTKGAFALAPGATDIMGNRIGESRWQPRGEKGRYSKAVNFDLTDVVKQLGIKGAVRKGARYIPQIGPYLQGYLTIEDTFKALTGKSPTREFFPQAKRSIKDQSIPRPATLMIR